MKHGSESGQMTWRNQIFLMFIFSLLLGGLNVVQPTIFQGLGDMNISLINIYINYAASVLPEEIH